MPPAPLSPRVSVIVPAHGVAHHLGEALDSLLRQTFAHWECLVVDDGAPDDVAGAVGPYLADPRVGFLSTANGGVSSARNRAIAQTSAPLLTLLDGDDLLLPRYLERAVAEMEADPDARLVTANSRIFGAVARERLCVDRKQGSTDGVRGTLAEVLDRSFNVHIVSTFRRRDFEAVGGFDESMSHSEDFDFWVRLLLRGGHARYIDEVLSEYRIRADSASASGARMIRGNLRVYEKALEFLGTGPEAGIAHRMIAENHAMLAFEEAVQQVAAGDIAAGLPALRKAARGRSSMTWRLSFLLWQVLPQLAPPMMRRRARNNSRGLAEKLVPPLSANLPVQKLPA